MSAPVDTVIVARVLNKLIPQFRWASCDQMTALAWCEQTLDERGLQNNTRRFLPRATISLCQHTPPRVASYPIERGRNQQTGLTGKGMAVELALHAGRAHRSLAGSTETPSARARVVTLIEQFWREPASQTARWRMSRIQARAKSANTRGPKKTTAKFVSDKNRSREVERRRTLS